MTHRLAQIAVTDSAENASKKAWLDASMNVQPVENIYPLIEVVGVIHNSIA